MDPPGKKTVAAVHQEVTREVHIWLTRILAEQHTRPQMDLEAVEMNLRSTLHQIGATALEQLLHYQEPAPDQRQQPCPCGQSATYVGLRSKSLLTVLGKAKLCRPYYLCGQCGQGQFPVDVELDVNKTEKSPGVRRMQAMVGQETSFQRGQQQIKLLAGIEVTAKDVERSAEAIGADIARIERQRREQALQPTLPGSTIPTIPVMYIEMDGTGVPVVKKETVDRQGKTSGQPAHTREAKLGCVFTQTKWDKETGYAIREPDSTSYTGAIEGAEEFGQRLYAEACLRGWDGATLRVVLADGAEWIWNLADLHFSGAIQIVDLYHAREHLWAVARLLHPGDDVAQKRWVLRYQPMLDAGKIEKLVGHLRKMKGNSPELTEKLAKEADYFEKNANRMRYADFRKQHLFVGSGVIEAGCKTVIGSRTKQSGMFWTVNGANSIIALRCCLLNGRFEEYWEERSA